jgi:uncharacterized repeat protein (TIGR02059 family)
MNPTPDRVRSSWLFNHHFVGLGTARVLIGCAVALTLVLAGTLVMFPRTIAQASTTTWESRVDSNMINMMPCSSGNARMMGPAGSNVDLDGWSITTRPVSPHPGTVIFPGGDTFKIVNDCAINQETLRVHNLFGANPMKVNGVAASWVAGSGNWAGKEYFDLPFGDSLEVTFTQAGSWGTLKHLLYAPGDTTSTIGSTKGIISYPVNSWGDYDFSSTAPADTTAPTILSASVVPDGSSVILTYDEDLDVSSVPAVGDFALSAGGVVSGVSVSASTVTLTLGTPAIHSAETVTVSYNPGSDPIRDALGNVSATLSAYPVTNNSAVAPPTTTTPAPVVIVPPVPETTAPPAPTTTAPGNVPTLVSADNQAALTRTPGSATALVNGQPVEVEVFALADSAGAQTAPEDRTPEQVAELQQAAEAVAERLAAVAGGDIGIEVIATDTGAELSGVFPDRNVPVEDVIVVDVGESATLFAARSASGDIIEVQPGAVLEVTPEGEVAVIAYGLPVGDQVELVLMSTPTLLGTFIVDANGAIETLANIPDAIGSGDHTLVVASPNVQASLGLKVSDLTGSGAGAQSSERTLPAAGSSPASGPVIILLAMGGLLVLAARRRREMVID